MLFAIKTPEGYVRNRPNGNKYEYTSRINDARIFNKRGAAGNALNFVRNETEKTKNWKWSDVRVVEVGAIELM